MHIGTALLLLLLLHHAAIGCLRPTKYYWYHNIRVVQELYAALAAGPVTLFCHYSVS